jgi:hypothetical protein
MDYKSVRPSRRVGDATVDTIRARPRDEVGHDVSCGGRTLRVLPDGATTAKKRSWLISEAGDTADVANRALKDVGVAVRGDVLGLIAGHLALAGATNLWLDGVRLHPTDETRPLARVEIDVLSSDQILVTRFAT